MSWDDNVYYNPEKHGVETVLDWELSSGSYEFDIILVLKGEKGYYIGTDSGCSCPTPFEMYDTLDDFTGPLTAAEAREEAASLAKKSYYDFSDEDIEKELSVIV